MFVTVDCPELLERMGLGIRSDKESSIFTRVINHLSNQTNHRFSECGLRQNINLYRRPFLTWDQHPRISASGNQLKDYRCVSMDTLVPAPGASS